MWISTKCPSSQCFEAPSKQKFYLLTFIYINSARFLEINRRTFKNFALSLSIVQKE